MAYCDRELVPCSHARRRLAGLVCCRAGWTYRSFRAGPATRVGRDEMRHAGWPAAELLEQPGSGSGSGSGTVHVFGLTSLWYISAIVALVTAKLSVSALSAPLLLCASQFTTATALTAALLRMHEPPPPKVCRPLPPSAA